MNYFDDFITEEELNEIEKYDCLFSFRIISLDDKKNRKLLDSYAYRKYLQTLNESNTSDKKGGVTSE